jgi:DNA-binding transcriptional ArsR family regulator
MQSVFESVARYFSVLGEPTRLRILHALCQEEKCVNGLIRETGLAQANASRHLGLMYQAGLLSRRREGTQVFYKVADPLYIELCRTVSARLLARAEAELSPPGPNAAGASRPFPANEKEPTSV